MTEEERESNDITEKQIEEIAKGLPPEFGRFGKELETIGILPIPNKMRNFSAWKLFIFWAMASASATTPLIGGDLLYNMGGLKWAIVAMFLGLALGIAPTWLFSEMGGSKCRSRRWWSPGRPSDTEPPRHYPSSTP